MTMKFTLIAAAMCATFASAAPAFAQDSLFEPQSRIVRYDDLNLASARGRERLEIRLRHAAESVCGTASARALNEMRTTVHCRKQALKRTAPMVADATRTAAARYARRSAD